MKRTNYFTILILFIFALFILYSCENPAESESTTDTTESTTEEFESNTEIQTKVIFLQEVLVDQLMNH